MHLTQKQESLISQYLRDLSRRLDTNLPEKVRERTLRQIQSRIYYELEQLNSRSISDDDVMRVLRQAATQTPVAPPPAPDSASVSPPAPASAPRSKADTLRAKAGGTEPVWLGVCAYNAERFELEPWMLRLGMMIFGMVTGPLSVIVYLAGYAEFYHALNERERPTIDWLRVAIRVAAPLAILIGLRWGSGKVLELIAFGHERIFKEPMPVLETWDWFRNYEGSIFFFTLITVVPLALLSGLPLANAWGHSLKRLSQAITALYGVALCFGTASVLTGLILDRVKAYMEQ